MIKSRTFALIAALCFFVPIILPAQTASPTAPATNGAGPLATQKADTQSDRLAKLEQQIADAKSSADNAWMLTSSSLVLLMTGPGLALFYGGLVRKKNVLATMMQSFAMMAIVTVTWAIFGYALAFGEGNSIIGGLHNLFLRWCGARADC
jgi:ammonium transporter, Amt family